MTRRAYRPIRADVAHYTPTSTPAPDIDDDAALDMADNGQGGASEEEQRLEGQAQLVNWETLVREP